MSLIQKSSTNFIHILVQKFSRIVLFLKQLHGCCIHKHKTFTQPKSYEMSLPDDTTRLTVITVLATVNVITDLLIQCYHKLVIEVNTILKLLLLPSLSLSAVVLL